MRFFVASGPPSSATPVPVSEDAASRPLQLLPDRAGRIVRINVVVLLALVIGALVSASSVRTSLDWKLAEVDRSHSFNLWSWEAKTLATRESQAILAPTSTTAIATVNRYFEATRVAAAARARRDDSWARQAVTGSSTDLADTQRQLDAAEATLADLRPTVQTTLSAQIEDELNRQGIRPSLVSWAPASGFPFLLPRIVPGVFFQLGVLPDLLIVAPTDRIEIVGSVLVEPNLPADQIDLLEGGADALGLSSLVTGIGGLAAYPSMLPDSSSARDLLNTVAHEWTHHYLALRPLGQAYFQSYQMREINETVADIVGHEIGAAVYERSYRPPVIPAAPPPTPSKPSAAAPPDFGTLMRQIRVTTEQYLSRHDVAGANAYLANQQKELMKEGFYVRRLNTAYLSFFGSYSGGANPIEPKLRQIRSRSPSLAAFLATVEVFRTPADLDRA